MTEPWAELSQQLAASLSDRPVDGSVVEAEVDSQVGATEFDIIVESSGGEPDAQVIAFSALCDLLNTRLNEGAGQVLGCVLVDGPVDAAAFATGLTGMTRPSGVFTPVLPLERDQAQALVDAGVSLFDVVDNATALVEVAASRSPVTTEVAQTALSEIDELVARAVRSQAS